MPLNPAFHAMNELKKNIPNLKLKKTNSPDYYLVELPKNLIHLEIDEYVFSSMDSPHLSIYENYKLNEKNGLSAFHYSWHGILSKNDHEIPVVIHVYYDHFGNYLYCQLKNKLTLEVVSLEPEITRQIKNHAADNTHFLLDKICNYIATKCNEYENSITKNLEALDKLSVNFKENLTVYKKLAQRCIDLIKGKELWSFDGYDARVKLLEAIMSIEDNQKPNKKRISKLRFHPSQEQATENISNIGVIATPSESKPPQDELLIKLQEITLKLAQLEQDSDRTWENTLAIINLLVEKSKLLSSSDNRVFLPELEQELVETLARINSCRLQIISFFEEEALKNNLDAVSKLHPFISHISLPFFTKLVRAGHTDICAFLFDHFRHCKLYFNSFAQGSSSEKNHIENSFTLLHVAFKTYLEQENIAFFQMLIDKGVNINFYGTTNDIQHGILYLAITHEKEPLVKLLLANGAKTFNEAKKSNIHLDEATKKDLADKSAFKKFLHSVNKKPNTNFEIEECNLLHCALTTRNKNIIRLLLEHDRSLLQWKTSDGFDALGFEICNLKSAPDLEIIKLLLQFGADVEAMQGQGINKSSVLIFAAQRGDYETVKLLVEHGANPNRCLPAFMHYSNESKPLHYQYNITAYQKATIKGFTEIATYFLDQNHTPIDPLTLLLDLQMHYSLEDISINPETLGIYLDGLLFVHLNEIKSFFEADTLNQQIIEAEKLAKQFYKAKNFGAASQYFFIVLATEPKARLDIMFNLACSYLFTDKKSDSIKLFKLCYEKDPNSIIGTKALAQLTKLDAVDTNSHSKLAIGN